MAKRSKKRSAQPEEPFTFFIDRCLGRHDVPHAVRSALLEGESVEIHDEHFHKNAEDGEWLTVVGEKRWIILSQDRAIEREPLWRDALMKSQAVFFGVGSGHASGADVGRMLVSALPRVRTATRRFLPAMIASVTHSGVSVRWSSSERRERPYRYGIAKRDT